MAVVAVEPVVVESAEFGFVAVAAADAGVVVFVAAAVVEAVAADAAGP